MLAFAAVGALVFAATAPWFGELEPLEIVLQWTILAMVPLSLALRCEPLDVVTPPLVVWACRLYAPATVLASASVYLDTGLLAAGLTLPYLLVGAALFLDGCLRAWRRRTAQLEELAIDIGLLYLPFAGVWFASYRLGVRPLGVSDLIVLLATVHYLNAGYLALFLTGLAGRWLAARDRFGRRLILLSVATGIICPITVSFGIVYWPTVELVSAYTMEAGYYLLLALVAFVIVPEVRGWPSRILLTVSSAGLFAAMGWAITYTLKINTIPDLVETHGYIQAATFIPAGLLAWLAAGPLAAGRAEHGRAAEAAEEAARPRGLAQGQLMVPDDIAAFADIGPKLQVVADELVDTRDRRGVFALAYAGMFDDMSLRVADGTFHDATTLQAYAVRLANRYLGALREHDRRGELPRCWSLSLDGAAAGGGSVTQHLLTCLVVHIRHDHVLAVADTLAAAGAAVDRDRFHADYEAMEEALRWATDGLQAAIAAAYAPGLARVDGVMGSLDEHLTGSMMSRMRATAWDDALRLLAAGSDVERDRLRREIDDETCELVRRFSSRAVGAFAVLEDAERSRRLLPPGTLGLPWIGESLAFKRDPAGMLAERAQRHGPIFKTRLLGRSIVCVVGPEGFEALTDESRFERHGANPAHWVDLMGTVSSPLLDGEERLVRKRILLQAFTADAIASYLPLAEAAFDAHLARWQDRGRFEWVSELKSLSFSVCDALYRDHDPDHVDEEVQRLLESCYAGLQAPPVALPFTPLAAAKRSRDTLVRQFDEAIAAQRTDPRPSVLGVLVRAAEGGRTLTDAELRAELLQLYFASYGAIYSVMSAFIVAHELHHAAFVPALDEVRATVPTGPVAHRAHELPELGRLTKEVRRAFPLVACTLFWRAKHDVELLGYRVPAGWGVVGCVDATMQLEAAFSHPKSFDPTRFLPGGEGTAPNTYVAHGGGPPQSHHCAGEALADALFSLFGARLLRDCSWTLPSQRLDLDPGEGVPIPRDRLVVDVARVPAIR